MSRQRYGATSSSDFDHSRKYSSSSRDNKNSYYNRKNDKYYGNDHKISKNAHKPSAISDLRSRLPDRLSSRVTYDDHEYIDDDNLKDSGWYKVTVYGVGQYDLNVLIESLTKILGLDMFDPIESHLSRNNMCFFTKDNQLATFFRQNSGKFDLSADSKLVFSVKSCKEPRITSNNQRASKIMMLGQFTNDDISENQSNPMSSRSVKTRHLHTDHSLNQSIIKNVIIKRYNSDISHLDLSDFPKDKDFLENNSKVVIYSKEVTELLAQFFEQKSQSNEKILSIDLSDNRLFKFDMLVRNSEYLPHLQTIIFKNNSVDRMEEFNKLKCFNNLSNLNVSMNPIENDLTDKTIKIIRNTLGSLKVLNDQTLAPIIGFDLDFSRNLPNTLGDFSCVDVNIKQQILSFLNKYYQVFDNQISRDLLLEAYDDNAIFSLSVANTSRHELNWNKLSHNLLSRDLKDKSSMIMQNRLKVVGFLKDLPIVQTDFQSISVEIPICTPTVVVSIVRGQMAEVKNFNDILQPIAYWSFVRVFILKIIGDRILITNDQMTIKNMEKSKTNVRNPMNNSIEMDNSSSSFNSFINNNQQQQQQQQHHQFQSSTSFGSNSNQINQNNQINSSNFNNTPIVQNPLLQNISPDNMLILNQFSEITKMNYEWSMLCLNQNNWDYNQSVQAFHNLNEQNAIPNEAFIR